MYKSISPGEGAQRYVQPAEPFHDEHAVSVESEPSLVAREGIERHQQERVALVEDDHRHPGWDHQTVFPPDERKRKI